MKALIEPIGGEFYASAPAPWNERQKGATREEALENLKQALERRVANGAEEVEISGTLPPKPTSHPLAEFAGDLRGNPLFKEWVAEMQAYRSEQESMAE